MLGNKHGWGLKEMLLLSGILMLFLAIAIYYIYTFYQSFDMEMSSSYYHNLEEKLEYQAEIYLDDYYEGEMDAPITITRSVLRSYDLDISLEDQEGNHCSGYVIAENEKLHAYLSCPNYITDGYEDWRS